MCPVPLGYDIEFFIIIFIKPVLITLLSVTKDIYADRAKFLRESSPHPRDIRGVQMSSGILFLKLTRVSITKFYYGRLCIQLSSVISFGYEASFPNGRSDSS